MRRRRRFILAFLCLAPFLLTALTWLTITHRDRLQDRAARFILTHNLPIAHDWATAHWQRLMIVEDCGSPVVTDIVNTTETPQLTEPIPFDTPPAAPHRSPGSLSAALARPQL